MKVIKLTDLRDLLEKNGNTVNAYQCEHLPTIDLDYGSYMVEISYKLVVEGYSEDDALKAAEGMIQKGLVPYDYSTVYKQED